jgi:hypothetical protein
MAQAVLQRNDDKKLIRFYPCSSVEKLFFFYVCFWLKVGIHI